jgi:hypothetical protein
VRTDPGEAAAFVADIGVDALAVAVGSSHAMTTRTACLDHELITRLRAPPIPESRACRRTPGSCTRSRRAGRCRRSRW